MLTFDFAPLYRSTVGDDFPGHVDVPVSLNTLHLRQQKRDFGSVVQIGLFSATVRARRGKNRPFGQGLAPAPAAQVKPRFETAGFRVFQNFREFPRVVLRKVQRRYGLRSSTSWHSSLSVDYSKDMEYLEAAGPADFGTVEMPGPFEAPAVTPWT